MLLKSLADAGVSEVLGMLGLTYKLDADMEADVTKLAELLEKAVELGDALAAYNIELLCQHGMQG